MEISRKHGRHLVRNVLLVGILVSSVILAYWFVIKPLYFYESLRLPSDRQYQFSVNSETVIKQVTFGCENNGTAEVTIDNFWLNGTLLNRSEWGTDASVSIEPKVVVTLFLTPEIAFIRDYHYNVTLGTVTGNHFVFLLDADQDHIEAENLTIRQLDFNTYPLFSDMAGDQYMDVRITNGPTTSIVNMVYVNGTPLNITQWFYQDEQNAITIDYGSWRAGNTYQVLISTLAGNTYQISGTPPQK